MLLHQMLMKLTIKWKAIEKLITQSAPTMETTPPQYKDVKLESFAPLQLKICFQYSPKTWLKNQGFTVILSSNQLVRKFNKSDCLKYYQQCTLTRD
jgi:hypothetical protein